MVQAIQGYFNNGVFYQEGRQVALPERKLVIVNVLDIPIDITESKKSDAEFWSAFDEMVKEANDEELLTADFPRMNFQRDLIMFDDEELLP